MSRRRPLAALGNAYRALADIHRGMGELGGRIGALEERLAVIEGGLRALAADERRTRSRLEQLRAGPDYEAAWSERRPLVSVTVATIGRPELVELSLPSVLAQSYGEIEVIVVGDGAGEETAAAIQALGDARVSYRDLGPRVEWTDDRRKDWLVAATRPRNAAMAAARGRWVVSWDDDDSMRPGCIESLLALAREHRAEAAYGKVMVHRDGGFEMGVYPPRESFFSWAGAIYHSGLRFLEREVLAADLDTPGDWWLAERMLRAGVRFAFTEEVLCDIYPSQEGLQTGYVAPWLRPRPG